ncbi:hypothetical protein DYB38_009141 [Aphanomyces astaci]|uniref:Glucosidase II subunit alpha n=1 Tax=Aphanomyces astaci TaxID=112090 RepID=A0A397A1S7_APHAT|nr:hypothetical protein DYB36_007058 [Aphanomyces astaci]RHY51345.1 hypothetical protein DYB38_009141 [Aphanomyces astaci]
MVGFGRVSTWLAAALAIAALSSSVDAVDRSKFRRCDQAAFCSSQRQTVGSSDTSTYSLLAKPDAATSSSSVYYFSLVPSTSKKPLHASLSFLQSGAVRLRTSEVAFDGALFDAHNAENDLTKPRWQPKDVLVDTTHSSFELTTSSPLTSIAAEDVAFLSTADVPTLVVLRGKPRAFAMEVYVNGELVVSTNTLGKLHYDARKDKNNDSNAATSSADDAASGVDVHGGKEIVDYGEDGLAIYADGTHQVKGTTETPAPVDDSSTWQESFGGHSDTKKFGSTAVGLDIHFHGQDRHLYGIPEHATDFVLKDTLSRDNTPVTDPYRLYNLDVFEYELNEPMALYGHIPMLMAASPSNTVGVFWYNPSETFVDIATPSTTQKSTHWMSESGWIDLFVLPGPTPAAVSDQFTQLTGRASLPPVFALGYHQCRWNYKNELDVSRVDQGFDTHVIPYDVLWLDIEHTDGKRYFTWDQHAFPTPVDMQASLSAVGRKMVTIVDPHMKRDANYAVHTDAQAQQVYITDENGNEFDGWCWPGSSSYVDFTSDKARRWWASQFRLDKYIGSTLDLYTWNDMNEPSVFNGPEVSMRKNCLSRAGVEHREWHNLYGYYMQRATMEGQLVRQLPEVPPSDQPIPLTAAVERPFVLSRAFFAGSQRYGAIWTGDNKADWGHLNYATKMLLSMSVASLTFVGADVGGFFGNPDAELVTRWSQAATYQPFFRGHAHHDSDRREPWVFGEPHTGRIREAIRRRYVILPYLYTVFHTCSVSGLPVMRPLWMEFSTDAKAFGVEDAFLLGGDILVHPITSAGTTSADVYLPGTDVWYNINESYKRLVGGTTYSVAAPIDYIPVFQRGGSIVPQRWRVRRSSALMRHDPYTLVVALNHAKAAVGELYVDDEHTFAFETDHKFTQVQFAFEYGILRSHVGSVGFDAADVKIERIVVVGLQQEPTTVKLFSDDGDVVELETAYDAIEDALTIRKPNVAVTSAWTIQFA